MAEAENCNINSIFTPSYLNQKLSVIMPFVILCLALMAHAASLHADAFPGAQGYGADITGGRGGQVIHVTNLNAAGPGSLQAALSNSGPRIIVFDVSGVITADEIIIEHVDFTLAGETAPGGGITLNARLNSAYLDFSVTNFVIRHIRIRPTNLSGNQGDAIRIANNSDFILDHISTSWGSDETIDAYQSHDFTIQWSTIEESATYAGHPDGDFHNYGFINGPDGRNVSLHHNLFAHHSHRTPAIANGISEIINNVSYNFKRGFNHHNPADTAGFNFIGNYYKAGPDENDPIVILIDDEDDSSGPYYYMEDLFYNGVASDPWDLVDFWPASISPAPSQAGSRINTPGITIPITTHACTVAYDLVLGQAGAWPRDTVTLRTIGEVTNGTGSWGRSVPTDLMEGLNPTAALTDSDNDGMPDEWETARGLNPSVAEDTGDDDGDGYTNIEEYLHDRSDILINGGISKCNDNGACEAGESYANCPNDCPAVLDITAPSTPNDLLAETVSSTQINLTWRACSDDVGVTGYRIYRDGIAVATTVDLLYSDNGLSPGTAYTYTIAAYDAAGNESEKSSTESSTTLSDSNNPGATSGDNGLGGSGGGCFINSLYPMVAKDGSIFVKDGVSIYHRQGFHP